MTISYWVSPLLSPAPHCTPVSGLGGEGVGQVWRWWVVPGPVTSFQLITHNKISIRVPGWVWLLAAGHTNKYALTSHSVTNQSPVT